MNKREVLQPPMDDLVNLIKLVLTRNNFTFNDEHYLQVHGTAMGTRTAPSYANIFMGRLENRLLERVTIRPATVVSGGDIQMTCLPSGHMVRSALKAS